MSEPESEISDNVDDGDDDDDDDEASTSTEPSTSRTQKPVVKCEQSEEPSTSKVKAETTRSLGQGEESDED
ncbi:unnamed protein product [Plutella xylostella]|uniref:(diamondback moth) hypothetical protein n=1 Tax=Plutella xylostella TaxID=51655 RepID=A0A8S4G9Z4_PLUXY|nr:unnamed protein product [Plutella xylostella]